MTPPRAKVVLLDDSPTVRKVVAFRLEAAGYQVKAARDVAELTACLAELKPDVVLLDVMMPEFFGDDLVGYVRGHAADTAVLFFSGLEEPKLRELVLSAGSDGYICKTDGFKDIADRLDLFFAQRRAE